MRIIECYIENFGKISAKKYDFSKGLNCFKEDNGSGKTTLAAFIRVMLYGMSDTKKQSLDDNDRKHYLPWNGAPCGGSLTFESGGKIYRVERSFAPKAADDTMKVYDTSNGRATAMFDGGLGEIIFGIDADGFERTVFLSERALSPKSENKSISAKLSDLVGCDGDIGAMDEAMKRLEEERKFYYKKGGSGELADTKAKIDEINRRLASLNEIERAMDSTRIKITELAEGISEAKKYSATLMKERENAIVKAAEVGYEKQSAQLKADLDRALEERARVSEIFGDRIPTFADIDDASYKSTEAKNIMYTIKDSPERAEFTRLTERFDGILDRTRVERAKIAISELRAIEGKKNDPRVQKAKKIFKNRVPREAEIEEIESLASSGKPKSGKWVIPAVIISVIAAVVGAILHPALIVEGLVGLVATFLIDAAGRRKQITAQAQKVDDFFLSVSGVRCDDDEEIFDRLREMRSYIDVLGGLNESVDDQMEVIEGLVNLFPDGRGGDLVVSCENIIKEYERYAELSVAERYIMGDRIAKGERAERMSLEAEKFIAQFKTKTNDPFGELRQALTEYNRLTSVIVAKRDEIARLESLNSLGESTHRQAMAEVSDIDIKRRANEEKIAAMEKELALTERTYAGYSDDVDSREELIMRRGELEDKLRRHQENYDTILLTKKYITMAKDNMSARYLGKTKAGFIKYAEIIGNISGESFEMDTDFGITKQEGATTKSIEAYSRGTRDLFNLAARLALVDSLYELEKPPVILDDPFTAFDDKKTDAALKLLKEFSKERQIIYFTCAKARCL